MNVQSRNVRWKTILGANIMDFIELIEKNWPILAGILFFILTLILISAITAYKLCKRTYTELLDGAEGRVTISEERAALTAERARMAEEQLSIMRRKLESMEPDAFDAKIDDVVTNIQEVEYSRLNGIVRQLNELKVGEVHSQNFTEKSDVTSSPVVAEEISQSDDQDTGASLSKENSDTTDESVGAVVDSAINARSQNFESIDSDEITAAVKRNMTPA